MGKSRSNKKDKKTEVIYLRVPAHVHKSITDIIVEKYNKTGELDKLSDTVSSILQKGLEIYSPAKSA